MCLRSSGSLFSIALMGFIQAKMCLEAEEHGLPPTLRFVHVVRNTHPGARDDCQASFYPTNDTSDGKQHSLPKKLLSSDDAHDSFLGAHLSPRFPLVCFLS